MFVFKYDPQLNSGVVILNIESGSSSTHYYTQYFTSMISYVYTWERGDCVLKNSDTYISVAN